MKRVSLTGVVAFIILCLLIVFDKHLLKDESEETVVSSQNTIITHHQHKLKCYDSRGYVVPCWKL